MNARGGLVNESGWSSRRRRVIPIVIRQKGRSLRIAMTTATCIYCGNLKLGAFVPCQACDRTPTERTDVVRSLILTDHYFTHEELSAFGDQIKSGREPEIDSEVERAVATQVDDSMLEKLVRISDPGYREYCRIRERNVILVLMTAIIGGIVWMLYRFAVG